MQHLVRYFSKIIGRSFGDLKIEMDEANSKGPSILVLVLDFIDLHRFATDVFFFTFKLIYTVCVKIVILFLFIVIELSV